MQQEFVGRPGEDHRIIAVIEMAVIVDPFGAGGLVEKMHGCDPGARASSPASFS